jgi:hypothetical protein
VRVCFGNDHPLVGERVDHGMAGHGDDVVAGIEGPLHEPAAGESVGSKDSDLHGVLPLGLRPQAGSPSACTRSVEFRSADVTATF